MTLISSFASPSVGLVAISDIIISKPWEGVTYNVRLPLRPEGLIHRAGNKVLCDVAQKTVIFGRTMIQWSGWRDTARKLLWHIFESTAGGASYIERDFILNINELSEIEKKNVKIAYHYNVDEMHSRNWHWDCLTEGMLDTDMHYQGSGVSSYFFNTEVTAPESIDYRAVMMGGAFARAATHIMSEALTDARMDEMFGGWLEFATKGNQSFYKKNYAIKFWYVNNQQEIIGMPPLIFCWYAKHDLLICRLDFISVEDSIKMKPDLFIIPDFLGRDGFNPTTDVCPHYDPYMIFHLIMNIDTGEKRGLTTFEYDDGGFKATVTREGGADFHLSDDFKRKLHEPSDSVWTIHADESD